MTPNEYEALTKGDVIEHSVTLARKVVVLHRPAEQVTQIVKDELAKQYGLWKIITKRKQDEKTL